MSVAMRGATEISFSRFAAACSVVVVAAVVEARSSKRLRMSMFELELPRLDDFPLARYPAARRHTGPMREVGTCLEASEL